MKHKFSRMRGEETTQSPVSVPPLRITDHTLTDTASDGIKLGCPFCENIKHFELYVHNTDADNQFYRCLTCLGTFDFNIVELNNPKVTTAPRIQRPRPRRRPRNR